jgi:hypothetical protein
MQISMKRNDALLDGVDEIVLIDGGDNGPMMPLNSPLNGVEFGTTGARKAQ